MSSFTSPRERMEIFENLRNIAALPGEFTTKKVKGSLYHYYQAALPGGRMQFYLGRDGEEIRRLATEIGEKCGLAAAIAHRLVNIGNN